MKTASSILVNDGDELGQLSETCPCNCKIGVEVSQHNRRFPAVQVHRSGLGGAEFTNQVRQGAGNPGSTMRVPLRSRRRPYKPLEGFASSKVGRCHWPG
jgi:hypothetical protein